MKWKMVPTKPDQAMLDAARTSGWGLNGYWEQYPYEDLVAAAPEFEPDDEMVKRAVEAVCRSEAWGSSWRQETATKLCRAALKAALERKPKL